MRKKTKLTRIFDDDLKFVKSMARDMQREFNMNNIGSAAVLRKLINKEKKKRKFEL